MVFSFFAASFPIDSHFQDIEDYVLIGVFRRAAIRYRQII